MSRNRSDLEAAASHVAYEYEQALAMLSPARVADSPASDRMQKAALESGLLHLRNMIEFLFGRQRGGTWGHRHSNDIRPQDFGVEWEAPDTEASARLKSRLEVIDRHLSHLSWHRIDGGREPWEYQEATADLISIWIAFAGHVQEDSPGGALLRYAGDP